MIHEKPQLVLPDPENLIAYWPEELTPTVSRARYINIASKHGSKQGQRTASWNVLADIYAVDMLGLRTAKEKAFGGQAAAELIREIEVPVFQESGLLFRQSPFISDPERGFCFPHEVDDLDIRSFYKFSRDLLSLKEWGRNPYEQNLLRRWKAGNKAHQRMADHWGSVSKYLVRQESQRLTS